MLWLQVHSNQGTQEMASFISWGNQFYTIIRTQLFALLLAIFLLSATAVAGLAASSDNSVKVINNLADRNIDTKELLRVINEAEISLMKELQQLKKENFTFNYVFIGDEVSYLYEKSANGLAEIVVFPTYESKKNSSAVDKDSFSDGTVSPAAQVDLP